MAMSAFRVAALADQRFRDLLPNVFFRGFLVPRLAVDKIQYFALLDDDDGGEGFVVHALAIVALYY